MQHQINNQRQPERPHRLEYIPFSFIRTPQDAVRLRDIEAYTALLDKGTKLKPVELMEPPGEEVTVFVLVEGNHRCRTLMDIGEPGTWAYVLEGRSYSVQGKLKRIDELEIIKTL